MEVRNCPKCKRLFNYLVGATPICPSCLEREKDLFQQTKTYIANNRNVSARQVVENVEGVTNNMIKRWIREGSLYFENTSGIGLVCERCGTEISGGKYCGNCINDLKKEISVYNINQLAKPVNNVRTGAKMHTRFLN